jgi:D-alanyl-D-alanine carboxypeptidase (penicillin-binding protein 5/6)
VRAPIAEGQPIGVIRVWRGKEVAVETPIHAVEAVGVGSTMRRAMDGALELVIGAVRSGAARL